MDAKGHVSTYDLYDANGVHLRSCPLGALQALATVRQYLEPYARLSLSDDQTTIRARYGSGDNERIYTYRVRRAAA